MLLLPVDRLQGLGEAGAAYQGWSDQGSTQLGPWTEPVPFPQLVTAPSEAEDTCRAYLAITPAV